LIIYLINFLGLPEIATQAAADKSLLKTQVGDLAAENAVLKTKSEGLAVAVSQIKAKQTKAQELADKHRAKAEARDKNFQQRL
jgi:uncharacterized phage infection (PIP) family protein YhgE